jgi:ethanolamine utilization protein EutN
MILGTVVGAVWGARHAAGLDGEKLLVVRREDGATVVAVDRLGAGPGDRVLTAHGSRVRDLTVGEPLPLKDVVVAIVDGVMGIPEAEAIDGDAAAGPRHDGDAAAGPRHGGDTAAERSR